MNAAQTLLLIIFGGCLFCAGVSLGIYLERIKR